jgi:phosphatidylserine synthase
MLVVVVALLLLSSLLFAESPWWRFGDVLFIDDVDYIQILIITVYIIVLCIVATVSTIVINA